MIKLTEKEKKILVMIGRGLDNKEIGKILNISHNTSKVYVSSILNKLNSKDRTEAYTKALKLGLINLDNVDINTDKS